MGIYREATRTARKPHICDACSRRIEPGSTYLYIVGHNLDGDFGSSSYHPDCREWEVHLCTIAGLLPDEWTTLAEWVEEDRHSLDGAPESVRARFAVPAPQPVP